MKKISPKKTVTTEITEILRTHLESIFKSNIKIAKSRLELYYKTGVIKKSLKKLRVKHYIKVVDFEDDHFPCYESNDISVFTSSRWFRSLTDKQEKELTRDIVKELQKLELPLALFENYLTALIYDSKIKHPLMPNYFLYMLSMLDDNFKPLNLTTEDKKFLKAKIKNLLEIKPKGRVPKDKKKQWEIIKRIIFDKGKSKIRRLRSNKLKFLALKEKESYWKGYTWNPEKNAKKERDIDIVSRLYQKDEDDSKEADRKRAQNLRKHRERIKKKIKKITT